MEMKEKSKLTELMSAYRTVFIEQWHMVNTLDSQF